MECGRQERIGNLPNPELNYCCDCGNKLSELPKCKCGKELQRVRFCTKCGVRTPYKDELFSGFDMLKDMQ